MSITAPKVSAGYPEPWRAIPRTPFEHELVISIECYPRSLPSAIFNPVWNVLSTVEVGRGNLGAEFKRAGMQVVEDIKNKYGHAAFMRREAGRPVETHSGLEICGYLPYFRQREIKIDGQLDYSQDMDVVERWKNLILYRRKYPGAISDDSDQQPISAVAIAVSKHQFDLIPERVEVWSQGRDYHSIAKKAENCWVVPLRILQEVGVRVPRALTQYLTPDEVDRDIRNGVLLRNLAPPTRERIALLGPDDMAPAMNAYMENFKRYGAPKTLSPLLVPA